MLNDYAYIAMNRFLYGTDAFSYKALQGKRSIYEIQQWLIEQLQEYRLDSQLWSSQEAINGYYQFKQAQTQETKSSANKSSMLPKMNSGNLRKKLVNQSIKLAEHTALANINHKQALQSRLLDFFSNHFSVSRQNLPMTLLSPTLEVEAIAPNLHLNFANMLKAVIQHPAMLLYLNNEQSSGPNSKAVQRQKNNKKKKIRGLNENLAREILELHTLGVDAPYTQQDVIELAKGITGWSVGSVKRNEPAAFKFRPFTHEPGARVLLGKTYPQAQNGQQQGLSMLNDIAIHPATAQHISYKLAKHFIADSPSKGMVDSMARTWLKTNGHIPSVIETLIKHKESWSLTLQKFKTPREFVISTCRACGVTKLRPDLYRTLVILGQGMFEAGSPAGYEDDQNAWLGASALNSRIEWTSHFSNAVANNKKDILELANRTLGPLLSDDTLQTIRRAESKQQALTMLLMSPEFQRR